MLNQIILVGKLSKKPSYITKGDHNHLIIQLDVQRPYQEATGESKVDSFMIKLWRGVSNKINEDTAIGSLLIVKGSLFIDELPYINAESIRIVK